MCTVCLGKLYFISHPVQCGDQNYENRKINVAKLSESIQHTQAPFSKDSVSTAKTHLEN